MTSEIEKYVGTVALSGQLQLELLKKEGLTSSSTVLEIGCGCLHLAVPLVDFLQPGHYIGIDPNEWLREPFLYHIPIDKHARFFSNADFDASALNIKFDYVFSHSILSHCANWQLEQFLQNTSKVLAPNGRIISSIRLAEGNIYGCAGTRDKNDSGDTEWRYPSVSWFSVSTINAQAKKFNLAVTVMPEYTEFYIQSRPEECHDWLVFSQI